MLVVDVVDDVFYFQVHFVDERLIDLVDVWLDDIDVKRKQREHGAATQLLTWCEKQQSFVKL
jgi:hypothetical protein